MSEKEDNSKVEQETSEKDPNTVFVVDATGHTVKTTPERAERMKEMGQYTPGTKEQAVSEAQNAKDLALAEETGAPWAARAGGLSGMSFGLAAPAHIAIKEALEGPEAAERARHLWAGQKQMGAYKVGEFAGMIPAYGATSVEKGISKLVPEATSVLGGAARKAAIQGADMGLQGAITSMGHAVEESAIQNKDLTAEALLSAGRDGLIIGMGLGAAGGFAGELLNRGTPAVASAIGERLGGAEAAYLKQAGVKGVENPTAFVPQANELLGKDGLTLASNSGKVAEAALRNEETFTKLRVATAKEFDKAATGAVPLWDNFVNRVKNDVIGEIAAQPGGMDRAALIDSFMKKMAPADTGNATKKAFEGWVSGRDHIITKAERLGPQVKNKIVNAYDSVLRDAMEEAETLEPTLVGAAGRYQSAEAGRSLAKSIGELVEKGAEKSLGESVLPSGPMGVVAGVLSGHTGKGIAYALAKKALAGPIAKATADTVYKLSVAGRAGLAVAEMKGAIGKATEGFLKGSKAANRMVVSGISRKMLEDDLNHIYKEQVRQPQDALQQYLKHAENLQIADVMTRKRADAFTYLQKITPADQETINAASLRPMPKPVGLTANEHGFLQKLAVIKNPYSILDELKNGSISKSQVEALKTVWPEFHSMITSELKSKIAEMKGKGKTLDVGRITQLSILLDEPLDPIMEPRFIQPVQQALNTVEPKPQMPAQPKATPEDYQTPFEEGLAQ